MSDEIHVRRKTTPHRMPPKRTDEGRLRGPKFGTQCSGNYACSNTVYRGGSGGEPRRPRQRRPSEIPHLGTSDMLQGTQISTWQRPAEVGREGSHIPRTNLKKLTHAEHRLGHSSLTCTFMIVKRPSQPSSGHHTFSAVTGTRTCLVKMSRRP